MLADIFIHIAHTLFKSISRMTINFIEDEAVSNSVLL